MLDNLTSALLNIVCRASSDKIFMCFYRNHFDSSPSAYIGHFWAKTTQYVEHMGIYFGASSQMRKLKQWLWKLATHRNHDLITVENLDRRGTRQIIYHSKRHLSNLIRNIIFIESEAFCQTYWNLNGIWPFSSMSTLQLCQYDVTAFETFHKLLRSIRFEENVQNWCCCFQ